MRHDPRHTGISGEPFSIDGIGKQHPIEATSQEIEPLLRRKYDQRRRVADDARHSEAAKPFQRLDLFRKIIVRDRDTELAEQSHHLLARLLEYPRRLAQAQIARLERSDGDPFSKTQVNQRVIEGCGNSDRLAAPRDEQILATVEDLSEHARIGLERFDTDGFHQPGTPRKGYPKYSRAA
ncbi:hypothetical protein THIOKS12670041 [Thiocapsa sp. KS1]|nr:hypothetical protein THIOKS12670041 [Thiocapsa sp. KS1]